MLQEKPPSHPVGCRGLPASCPSPGHGPLASAPRRVRRRRLPGVLRSCGDRLAFPVPDDAILRVLKTVPQANEEFGTNTTRRTLEIGRASCWERMCQYGLQLGVAQTFK